MVNEEIWKYFNEHRDKNHTFKVDTKDPEFKDVKKWFGWFGDEGISNMDRLQDKLREAQTKLHGNLISLDLKRKALFNDITLWATPRASTPQAKEQQKQNLMKRADGLADEYMKLAQDLWYVWYRLARTFMYFEMLQLTVKGLLKGMEGELARLENEAAGFFENDVEAYERLRHQLNSFPLFLK